MRITTKHVIIETTNRIHGCLEQGGIRDRVEAYPISEAMHVTGLSEEELRDADDFDMVPGSQATVRQMLEHHIAPRIIRRGRRIE